VNKSAVPDQPDGQAPPVAEPSACGGQPDLVSKAANDLGNLAQFDAELRLWNGFDTARRRAELRAVIRAERIASAEVVLSNNRIEADQAAAR
jgi:hypothetical protein